MNNQMENMISSMIFISKIAELDYENHQVRVALYDGDQNSTWIRWPADIGNNYVRWRPLRLNTQCVVIAPSGDLSRAVIVGQLYSDDIPESLTDESKDQISFEDGTEIIYQTNSDEPGASEMTINGSGMLTINCSGNVQVNSEGSTTVTGKSSVTVQSDGKATVKGSTVELIDSTGGGVVCQKHLCAFTGSPHPEASTTVLGAK